ncbi:MAG: hypothetical protein WBV23_08275, partial [Desulfobaccales bacterium]
PWFLVNFGLFFIKNMAMAIKNRPWPGHGPGPVLAPDGPLPGVAKAPAGLWPGPFFLPLDIC